MDRKEQVIDAAYFLTSRKLSARLAADGAAAEHYRLGRAQAFTSPPDADQHPEAR
jgi:hypothetical protein